MYTLLLFFNRKSGVVKALEYDEGGRLRGEESFKNIKSIEFHGANVRSAQGMEHSITLYVVEGGARVEAKGSRLVVRGFGESGS